MSLKIALFGYGKMGKEIEAIAKEKGHSIVLIVDENNAATISVADLKKADVAIEFSTPLTAVENIYKCFAAELPVVVGTTGWYERFDEVKHKCETNNGALLHATNFSVGVNLFFEMNRKMAVLMSGHKEYDVIVEEVHHVHKKDAPSGTALTTAADIIKHGNKKTSWRLNESNAADVLRVDAIRLDEVPGTHSVFYKSDIDFIELKHVAHSRKGFAAGAVVAAEWLQHKKGIFTMKEVLGF